MKNRVLSGIVALLLVGCGRNEIQTTQVPKEPSSAFVPQSRMPETQRAPARDKGFAAALPEGWTETPGSGMRRVSYSIEGTGIDFYLVSLVTCDMAANINRWRGQVGLPAASPEEIAKEVESFRVDGRDVRYVEIYNDGGGRGIVAAIIDLAPEYWYFTAKGSAGELKSNTAALRAYLESITFEGHSH